MHERHGQQQRNKKSAGNILDVQNNFENERTKHNFKEYQKMS